MNRVPAITRPEGQKPWKSLTVGTSVLRASDTCLCSSEAKVSKKRTDLSLVAAHNRRFSVLLDYHLTERDTLRTFLPWSSTAMWPHVLSPLTRSSLLISWHQTLWFHPERYVQYTWASCKPPSAPTTTSTMMTGRGSLPAFFPELHTNVCTQHLSLAWLSPQPPPCPSCSRLPQPVTCFLYSQFFVSLCRMTSACPQLPCPFQPHSPKCFWFHLLQDLFPTPQKTNPSLSLILAPPALCTYLYESTNQNNFRLSMYSYMLPPDWWLLRRGSGVPISASQNQDSVASGWQQLLNKYWLRAVIK